MVGHSTTRPLKNDASSEEYPQIIITNSQKVEAGSANSERINQVVDGHRQWSQTQNAETKNSKLQPRQTNPRLPK